MHQDIQVATMLSLFLLSVFIGGTFGRCTWGSGLRNFLLTGANDKRLTDLTQQECLLACEAESSFICLSIEYYAGSLGRTCYLSSKTSREVQLIPFIGWTYFQRTCPEPINRPYSCTCMGDPHCLSFDGLMNHFMGTCFYTMARDNCANNFPDGEPTWEVIVNMDKYHPSHYVSFTTYAIVKFYDLGLSIELARDMSVLINGHPAIGFPAKPSPELTISRTLTTIFVTTKTGIQVVWYPPSWSITVNAPDAFKAAMCGLCGDANGNTANDWTIGNADLCLPDAFPNAVPGTITGNVQEFGYSWTSALDQNEQECLNLCPNPPEVEECTAEERQRAGEHCEPITDPSGPFEECLNAMSESEKANFAENCIQDACLMDNYDDTVCSHAATLTRFCMQTYQIEVQWRSETLCPLECGQGMTYKACGSICMPTCSDFYGINCGDTDTCEEGCYCEEGLVYDGEGSCFPREQCGCAVPNRGVFINVGASFLTTNCNQECSCNEPQGELECVAFSCPDNEACTVESGKRVCECQDPYVVTDGVCSEPDDCSLDPDEGTGSKTLTRYYWDPVKEKCKEFTYKGQGGNANNFKTKKACKAECKGEFPAFCNLPKDKGTGDQKITRYYYKADTNKCKKMAYTGVGGNENNFETKAECRATCK